MANASGYTKPNPSIEVGVESGKMWLTNISFFDYQPAVSKAAVPGLGYETKLQSLTYVRARGRISIGGGASLLHVSTSQWSKNSVMAIAGCMIEGKAGRVFANYERSVALDQNRLQAIKFDGELGHGRIRPEVSIGVSRFTEPSYCAGACNVDWSPLVEVGAKFIIHRK
jgi:hypothetical protein